MIVSPVTKSHRITSLDAQPKTSTGRPGRKPTDVTPSVPESMNFIFFSFLRSNRHTEPSSASPASSSPSCDNARQRMGDFVPCRTNAEVSPAIRFRIQTPTRKLSLPMSYRCALDTVDSSACETSSASFSEKTNAFDGDSVCYKVIDPRIWCSLSILVFR